MDIILIPGLWLDGSSWAKVLPVLEQAGHRPHPLTLPAMQSRSADRSRVHLRDHVEAVVALIDSLGQRRVVLVGHSAGGAIAHAAVDARPDRVARVIYVGGFPIGDGDAIAEGYPAENGEVPLPDWSAFEDAELAGLNEEARAEFRMRAIPSPEHVTRDPQHLSNERRYDVPVTVICTEFTSQMLRGWIGQGQAPVREFTKIRDLAYIDLPTGHWPQLSRPADLARAILKAIGRTPPDHKPAERRARRAAAQEVLDGLAVEYLGRPDVTSGPMFGSQGLLRNGKFFAFVGRAGDLVLKLHEQQAAALVAAGTASVVRAGRNATREWVSVPRPPDEGTDRWSALLEDAYRYSGQSS